MPPFPGLAEEARAGRLSRREFLATATALGVTGPAAYGMLGLAVPTPARAQEPDAGRRAQDRHGGDAHGRPANLRLVAEGEPGAALRRAAGALHCRVHLRAMAARKLGSQRRRDRVHPEAAPERHLEQRRRLQRRRRDLQPQPLVREPRPQQLDGDAHGSPCSRRRARRRSRATSRRTTAASSRRSRPARSSAPATARSSKVDDFTVKLHLSEPDITIIPNFADYPALIVHRGFAEAGGDLSTAPVGTGPWELVSTDVGVKAVYKKRTNGTWWGDTRRRPRPGLSRRYRVHRLRHRPLGDDRRLRGRARSTPPTRRRRPTSRSSTASGSTSPRR